MNDKINELVTRYPEWNYEDSRLVANWRVADFTELRQIVMRLCDLADELNHHPTITYGYNTLSIETTTHDAGNEVTDKDLILATKISEMFE